MVELEIKQHLNLKSCSRNYPIEGHANQFVEREQLEIYKEKNER